MHACRIACCCPQSPDKTLQLVNEMWHVLTKEEGNRQLLCQIISWLSQRLPPSGSS